jgi:hypothetical protein
MADPFSSLAKNIMAVAGATTSSAHGLYKLIQAFRNAPLELAQLSNEVNDLRAVLSEVEIACRDIERNNDQTQDAVHFQTVLISQLDNSRLKLVELDTFIKSLISTLAFGGAQVTSLAWLRKKKTARAMVEAVKQIKSGLHILLETYIV